MNEQPSRRIVFQGLAALGVAAALAGCGGEEDTQPRASTPSTSDDSPSSSKPSGAPSSEVKGPAEDALATTDEIPVGGGIVLTDVRIVVTQPNPGEFRAFTAVCTHQGQTVGNVSDNTITCTFHGSQYDAASGDVTSGPATAGLDPVKIRVKRGRIVRA